MKRAELVSRIGAGRLLQRGPLVRKTVLVLAALVVVLAPLAYACWIRPHLAAVARARRENAAAAAALASGDQEAAERQWLEALADWPEDTDAYSALGDYYVRFGDPEVAGICYARLLAISPHYPHIYCRLAAGGRQLGADRDARDYAQKELKQDPKCLRALKILCAIDRHTGDLKKARQEGELLYRLAPNDEEAVCRYVETFMDAEPDLAISILSKAQKSLPGSSQVAFDLGWCYSHSAIDPAGVARAVEQLRMAEQLQPSNGAIYTELCRFLLEQNRAPEALAEGKLAIKYDRFNPQAYFHYSQCLHRLGQEAQAQKVRSQFVVLDEALTRKTTLERRYGAHPGDAKIAHELAEADTRLGDLHGAVVVMEIALYAHPRDPRVLKDFRQLMKLGASP